MGELMAGTNPTPYHWTAQQNAPRQPQSRPRLLVNSAKTESYKMETPFKSLTNFQNWRLAAITLGGALAMSLATTAFAAKPNLNANNDATGTVGVAFTTYQIQATNPPILSYGASPLPAGLSVNTSGQITGIPTTAGQTNVTLSATNGDGTTTKVVKFTINPPAPVVTSDTTSGTVGAAFSYQITATNSPTSYATTVSIPGVTFHATGPNAGSFSGTPTTAGTFNGNITATNVTGTGSGSLTVTINPPDTAPTALATISTSEAYANDTVTLDASQSHSNPTGSALTYQWNQLAPGSPTISLAPNNKAVTATFTAIDPGAGLNQAVTFRVVVTDDLAPPNQKNSFSDPVTTTVYALPVANAGPDQTLSIRETEVKTIYLNGSGTISRGAITYSWTQTGGPPVTWLTSTNVNNPSFQTTGTAGPITPLTFDLVVGDGTRTSTSDHVGVTLNTVADNVPTANAGTDQFVEEQAAVTLNGSATDADNDPLTFTWTQDSGVPVQNLSGSNTATLMFTAPEVPAGQNSTDVVFKLVVNDTFSDSAPSYVTVHVDNTNDPPVAVAKAGVDPNMTIGGTVNVNGGDLVYLNGVSSGDINGDTLSYSWTELSHSISITNPNTATASFTAPNAVQGYDFQLIVYDGEFYSAPSIVHVTVAHVNHDPLANAGPNQTVPEGALVQLDGTASGDEDGDAPLHYLWDQSGGNNTVTLSDKLSATPTFTAPNVGPDGDSLTFDLTVTDGHGGSKTDSVTITVQYVNQSPVADAGLDDTKDENTVMTLDGSGSSDPDGNTLTYSWSQVDGPDVLNLTGTNTASPSFQLPSVDRFEANVVMELTVDDGYGGSSTDDVTIHIHNVNLPPAADAGSNFSVQWGHLVNLSGSGTDPDTEEQPLLTYQWTAPVGVTLSGSGANVSFTAPPVPGQMYSAEQVLTFSLRVTDPNGAYSDDTIDVTVTNNGFSPSANAGGNQTVDEHSAVTLHGSGVDPNGDLIHFTWTKITPTAPDLDDPTSATPSFTAPFVNAAGATLTYQLLVWDDFGGWGLDSATITVKNINDPPDISHAYADPSILWAPDHRLVPVQIKGVTDPDNNATITITKVTQDEPTNGLGDGDTAIDAIISANHDSVQLRAERSGKGNGRVYWVYFTASDFEGGSSSQVKVMVPHDKKTDMAIDSGQNYDSTH
jgi:hypothetical protein